MKILKIMVTSIPDKANMLYKKSYPYIPWLVLVLLLLATGSRIVYNIRPTSNHPDVVFVYLASILLLWDNAKLRTRILKRK